MMLRVARPPNLPDGARIIVQDPSGRQVCLGARAAGKACHDCGERLPTLVTLVPAPHDAVSRQHSSGGRLWWLLPRPASRAAATSDGRRRAGDAYAGRARHAERSSQLPARRLGAHGTSRPVSFPPHGHGDD